ncbi:15195_t:CDS:2, partial [Racocetra persica]
KGRKWVELTVREFKIWLAILIYAGIFKLPSIRDYWNRDNRFSEHKITTFMTSLCFEQLIWDLINAGMEENSLVKKPNIRNQVKELAKDLDTDLSKKQYVTSNFELSLLRLTPEGHLPEWRKERESCMWC